MYLKDPVTKQPSVPLSAFVSGFIVCLCKLVFSGLSIGAIKLSNFTGGDFAAAVGALGVIYSIHTHVNSLADQASKNDSP